MLQYLLIKTAITTAMVNNTHALDSCYMRFPTEMDHSPRPDFNASAWTAHGK